MANGEIVYKTINQREQKEEFNQATSQMEKKWVMTPKKIVDYYKPNDPELYIIKVVDHVGLYSTERGMDLRQTIGKASSQDNVILRNIYGFTNVDIQQQAADKEGLEAFKMDRMTPTPDGLGENKTTQRDCNIMLGLFSPFRFEKPTWKGYDVSTFKDNIRFLEVCLNRNGSAGAICPLFFDGAVNFFAELPQPNNTQDLEVYRQMAIKAQQNN